MLKDASQKDYDNVFGNTYSEADTALKQVRLLVKEHKNKGFASREQCEAFVIEHHLDVAVYIKSAGDYRYMNHMGDVLTRSAWIQRYKKVLFWYEENEKGKPERRNYTPDDIDLEEPRIYGEVSDGKYQPLYKRNYFLPTGYYDEVSGTFNVAMPIHPFAKYTGADTTFIHILLQKIAGECYPYILSWLRAKMINPAAKTEVVPIFVGAQGTGKSSFGDAVCRALFGKDNVIVTDQFDSTARFNADSADALIISIEEKAQEDKRNTAANIKSRATAKKVRKENKGVDPIFQDSYTDYIMTTNELVPLKFEDRGPQRRFMVMEVDPNFTREKSPLAEAVFTKLYGLNVDNEKVCKSLCEDHATIAQFKQELWDQKNAENINYRRFPRTEAYERCFNVPRTNEAIEIETIIKSLVPFLKQSLMLGEIQEKITQQYEGEEITLYLDEVVSNKNALQFLHHFNDNPDRIAVCRQLVFVDTRFEKVYAHSVVERTLFDMRNWLQDQGLLLLGDSQPPKNGFRNITGKLKHSPTAWFALVEEAPSLPREASYEDIRALNMTGQIHDVKENRIGRRVPFNDRFLYDENGEFETLNELKPGCFTTKQENAQYLDTFLLEADETTYMIAMAELRRITLGKNRTEPIRAESLFEQRLSIQDAEADRLFNSGIVCRVVYSGSKSLHMLVRVDDAPSDLDERKWLDAYLKNTLSNRLKFDMCTKEPTRLTRAPITRERLSKVPDYDWLCHDFKYDPEELIKGTQRLLAEDWSHIYRINWRPIYDAWMNEPKAYYEERSKMLPSKPIYKEAALALLNSTFFIDTKWTGIRQDTFFPAYRLLRHMGYTHDELWLDFAVQISKYRKVSETQYWLTRKDCKLIRTIDEEIGNE